MGLENGGAAVDRRSVLQIAGGVGSAGLAGLAGCRAGGREPNTPEHPPLGNYRSRRCGPLGFACTVRTYAAEGATNSGDMSSLSHTSTRVAAVGQRSFDVLSGDGVLGKTVEYVSATRKRSRCCDSQRHGEVEHDDVIMFSGGSSSSVAIAQQEVAQAEKVPYMCCLTHSNDTTGTDVSATACGR